MSVRKRGRALKRPDVHEIQPTDRQRGDREKDAEPLGVVEESFFERQIERIVDVDTARQQLKLPRNRRVNFSLGRLARLAAIISRGSADAGVVKKFLTKQGKHS